MNKLSTLVFPSTLAAFAAFLVGDAHADNWEMPGQMCQPTSPTQAEKLSYESALGLRNNDANSALLVTCPVVIPGVETDRLTTAVVYIENHNLNQLFTCTMRLMEPTGEPVFTSTKSLADSAGIQNIVWDLPPSSGNIGLATMNCSVPAYQANGPGDGKSRVRAYWVHGEPR